MMEALRVEVFLNPVFWGFVTSSCGALYFALDNASLRRRLAYQEETRKTE